MSQKPEITYVVARNIHMFWMYFKDAYPDGALSYETARGRAKMDGHEVRYVPSERSLRGIHNANIQFWGPAPQWALTRDGELAIEHARRP